MIKFWRYYILGVIFWFVLDFTTVYIPDFKEWFSVMPGVFILYFGYPLLFSFVFYKWKLNWKFSFLLMIISICIVEILIVKNDFLIYIWAIPVYTIITYVPKWWIDGELKKHKAIITVCILFWIFIIWQIIGKQLAAGL